MSLSLQSLFFSIDALLDLHVLREVLRCAE